MFNSFPVQGLALAIPSLSRAEDTKLASVRSSSKFHAVPRCRIARWSQINTSPTLRGKPVCRLHGGRGGGPKGERNGAYRTGRYMANFQK